MNLKGIKVPEGIGGGERVKRWGLGIGGWDGGIGGMVRDG